MSEQKSLNGYTTVELAAFQDRLEAGEAELHYAWKKGRESILAADLWPLVRELAALVRWYRRGEPIKGMPKYLHGAEADKALAHVTALERREGKQKDSEKRREQGGRA